MNEPLFDGLTVVGAFLAIAAVLTLRPADPPPANVDRVKQRYMVGRVLLALSSGALLFRWIDSTSAFSTEARLGSVRQGLLMATCGLGVAAAILTVTATTLAARVKSFLTVALCGAIALLLAAAWEWALLWTSLLAFGAWAMLKLSRSEAKVAELDGEAPRESGLIMLAAASLLVLLLGTWQHVVEHESQRQTRSQRYSAWPRATALANAWERSGWVVKADDDDSKQPDRASAELVSQVAAREQRIAWGLAAMVLVVAGVAWRQAVPWHSTEPSVESFEEVPHGS